MKHAIHVFAIRNQNVAPHPGAWIETDADPQDRRLRMSPPTRGRGLKLCILHIFASEEASPPTRGRGLKLGHGGFVGYKWGRPPPGGVD